MTDRTCPDCGRYTTVWRGSMHKWRCAACVETVVGMAYHPADTRTRRERTGRPAVPVLDMPNPHTPRRTE
ncbi:hypothetical protein AB0H20_12575 [Nocardia fluminea]|uniref:hypothetical protein n=1 Tax=Nocardia fluminea TaxID=134984 RepID=UPI0034041097